MSDLDKVLSSIDLPSELKSAISEAWAEKIEEQKGSLRESIEKELKEQHQQDIQTLVEAADAVISSTLDREIREFRDERNEFRDSSERERVKQVKQRVQESKDAKRVTQLLENMIGDVLKVEMKELHEDRKSLRKKEGKLLESFDSIIKSTLSEEMSEFNDDRKALKESMTKMEGLVVNQLTRELSEFQQDKRALAEKSSRLEKEHARKLEESKQAFIKRTTVLANKTIDEALTKELTSLKEDIQVAKSNDFGRKIFEAFAGEYLTSHLSEGTEIHKLRKKLEESSKKAEKMRAFIAENERQLNKSRAQLHEARESSKRKDKLNELLRPLKGVQRETMKGLLESVATEKLEENFKRYVPSILGERVSSRKQERHVLSENSKPEQRKKLSEVTGDRVKESSINRDKLSESSLINDILSRAGVKK